MGLGKLGPEAILVKVTVIAGGWMAVKRVDVERA